MPNAFSISRLVLDSVLLNILPPIVRCPWLNGFRKSGRRADASSPMNTNGTGSLDVGCYPVSIQTEYEVYDS
jgi:hypothetical protein